MSNKKIKNQFIQEEASVAGSDDEEVVLESRDQEKHKKFDELLRKKRELVIDFESLEQLDQYDTQLTSYSEMAESVETVETKRQTNIYRIPCDKGQEIEAVFAITNKFQSEKIFDNSEAQILSVFSWKEKYPGAIFVEATSLVEAKKCAQRLKAIRLNIQQAVEIQDSHYPTIFNPDKSNSVQIFPGDWVRIASTLSFFYDDLGKVLEIEDRKGRAILKLIPREVTENTKGGNNWYNKQAKDIEQKKIRRGAKKKIQFAPPSKDDQFSSQFVYNSLNEEKRIAKQQGFILVKIPLKGLKYDNFNITPNEVLEFFPDVDNVSKLPILVRQSFRLHNIEERSKFQMTQQSEDSKQIQMQQLLNQIPKVKLYDYVYICDGDHQGYEGTIVKIEGVYADIWCGQSIKTVHLLDVNKSKQSLGRIDYKGSTNFKKYDLVQFGQIQQDYGCIISLGIFQAVVVDMNNQQKTLSLQQLKRGKESTCFMKGDEVQVLAGFYRNTKASVLCAYNDKVFIFNPKFLHLGVTVEYQENLFKITHKINKKKKIGFETSEVKNKIELKPNNDQIKPYNDQIKIENQFYR